MHECFRFFNSAQQWRDVYTMIFYSSASIFWKRILVVISAVVIIVVVIVVLTFANNMHLLPVVLDSVIP